MRCSRSGLSVAASRHPAAQLTDVHTVEDSFPMSFISTFDYARWLSASAVIAALYVLMAGRACAFGFDDVVQRARQLAASPFKKPADAAKELRLKPGERAAALIKSTEVMILRV